MSDLLQDQQRTWTWQAEVTLVLTVSPHKAFFILPPSHPYSVQLCNARVNQYSQSFIPFSGKLWTLITILSIFIPDDCFVLFCFFLSVCYLHIHHIDRMCYFVNLSVEEQSISVSLNIALFCYIHEESFEFDSAAHPNYTPGKGHFLYSFTIG